MKLMQRMHSGLVAKLDAWVSQIENHEAQLGLALGELKQGAARARGSLKQVKRHGDALRKERARLQAEQHDWQRRAIEHSTQAEDEETAIECLRRSKQAHALLIDIDTQLSEQDEQEKRLSRELRALGKYIQQLERRYQQMRTHDACAAATQVLNGIDGSGASDIERVFERWEVKVAMVGGFADSELDVDRFAEDFAKKEEDHALRAELAQLKQEKS